jgi:hypothetical protein
VQQTLQAGNFTCRRLRIQPLPSRVHARHELQNLVYECELRRDGNQTLLDENSVTVLQEHVSTRYDRYSDA